MRYVIESTSMVDLLAQLDELRTAALVISSREATSEVVTEVPIAPPAPVTPPVVQIVPPTAPVAPAAPVSVDLPTPPAEAPKRRGRPRTVQAAAAQPSAQAPAASAAAPQAQVGNSASVPPVAPPAEGAPQGAAAPAAATPTAAPAGDAPTVDQCRAALMAVSEKFDMARAVGVIGSFGVDRVSAIPEDKRKAFIAECNKLVA